MKTIEQIKEIVDKAHSLQQESTGLYRVFQQDFTKLKTEIQMNKDYSAGGKQKLIESLQKRKTVELLQGSRKLRNEFNGYWKEAKEAAESLIHSKIPKADPVKEERFNKRLAEVKTEILLSSHRKGKEVLAQFLQTVDEQGFAAKVKDEFPELISPILAGAGPDTAKYRMELLDMFEQVKTQSLPPEALEAMRIADVAEQAMQSSFFIPLVEEKAKQELGKEAGKYLNNPDEFFATYPDADIKLPPSGMKTVEQIMEEENAKTL